MSAKNSVNERISFASIQNQLEYPDFLEIQLKSFMEFFQLDTTPEDRGDEGLYKVFNENFPISDTRNNFVLNSLTILSIPPGIQLKNALNVVLPIVYH
jgi:DNA-directed RNA polymerase subunit beta